jgi:signal transduction histidine kinase
MELVANPHFGRATSEPDPRIASLALENARLGAALRQSRRELARAHAGSRLAGERIRRKLGQDLHDGAQQQLIAIQIMAGLARERTGDCELAEVIESIGTVAAQAADELRELSHGIYPALLEECGPGEALRAVARTSPIPIQVVDEGVGRCSGEVEAAIYFCSREALQNAIKHAGIDAHVMVTIGREPGGVFFEVADDGAGMELPARVSGIGLRSMRDRIEAVSGRIEIVSSPGMGTRVRGRVPDTA